MDIYRYVNRTQKPVVVGGITIPVAGDYISYDQPVPALDRLDGSLVDKYLNGRERQDPSEFNYYHPVISHEKGDGIYLNIGDPRYGWHDMLSYITVDTGAATGKPTFTSLVGNIKKYQFKVGDECFHMFHVLHDYAPGTDWYIHAHWTQNQPVTSGSVTWQFEASYAKGYSQAQFTSPAKVLTVTQIASTTPLTHQIAETQLTNPGGTGGLGNSNNLETDGIMMVRTTLLNNTTGVDPFLLFVDVHYQSTGIPTKNKNFNFWQ